MSQAPWVTPPYSPCSLWRGAVFCLILALPIAGSLFVPLGNQGRRGLHLTLFDPAVILLSSWLLADWWRRGCLYRHLATFLRKAWPAFTFVTVAALSLSASDFSLPQAGLLAGKSLFQLFLYLCCGSLVFWSWLQDSEALRPWNTALRWTGGLVALSVILQAFAIQATLPQSTHELGGLLLNRNTYGIALLLLLPCLLAGSTSLSRGRAVILYLLSSLSLFLSTAGGITLGILCGLVVMAAGEQGRIRILSIAILLSAALFWLIGSPLPGTGRNSLLDSVQVYVRHRDTESGEEKYLHTMRYFRWAANLEMLRANPWLGVGTGQYGNRLGEYFGPIALPEGRSDAATDFNVKTHEPFSFGWFFLIAGELGGAGVLALLLLLGGVVEGGLRHIRAGEATGTALLAILAGLLLAGWFSNPWVRGTGGLWSCILALAWSQGECIRGCRKTQGMGGSSEDTARVKSISTTTRDEFASHQTETAFKEKP